MSLNTILATAPLATTGFHIKATGTTLGNSLIWDNGTNVGIGNTNTSYTLDVTGTGYFSGIVGIGVAPSAWYNSSGYATLQVGNASLFGRNSTNSELYLSSNSYDNSSGNPTYITTDFAARYAQNDGVHYWFTAPSGTAGTATTFTERMRITQAGNVGIGTSSPDFPLTVKTDASANSIKIIGRSGGDGLLSFYGSNGTTAYLDFSVGATYVNYNAVNSQNYNWYCNSSLKMSLTSGGVLLIGGASATGAYDCSLGSATANTYYQVRSTNTNSLYGADTRGTWMGNLSSKEAYINCPSFVPGVDNATSCGSSSYRWTVVYAVNGSIQTSDERQKTDIFTSDLGLDFINKLNPVSYKWKVGGNDVEYSSIEDEDGKITPSSVATPKIGVRNHYGLIAQQVKEVLGDKDFGGFVHDKETDMMSLRYDQFISPLIKAIQEQQIQIQNLQEQINILAK